VKAVGVDDQLSSEFDAKTRKLCICRRRG